MSLLLRVALIVVAVVAAFAGGFFLRPYTNLATVAAEEKPGTDPRPKTYVTARTTERSSVATPTRIHPAVTTKGAVTTDGLLLPPVPVTPKVDDVPGIVIPPVPATPRPAPPPADPVRSEVPDPSDPAFQMIKNELRIKTTIIDKAAPLPAVLTDAKRNDDFPGIPIGTQAAPAPAIHLDVPPLPQPGNVTPPPLPPKLVNNRSIELDFEVTKTGRSKIRSVELWATRDGGRSWQKIDQMTGSESPFSTRLTTEGRYGFKLVFESETGKRTPEPQRGDTPDSSLVLDTTPPNIYLSEPVPVQGHPGKVLIQWSVVDVHRGAAGVRLDYSVDGKEWTSIGPVADGQMSHEWTVPKSVPPRVLLRVTVRDLAGNVATAQTKDKVAIDLVVPEGQIKGIRVAGTDLEKGPAPRVVQDRQMFAFWVALFGR